MIRIKGTIKNGKIVLSEPISLEEGADIDIIAYVERKSGKNLDKKTNTLEIDKNTDTLSHYDESSSYKSDKKYIDEEKMNSEALKDKQQQRDITTPHRMSSMRHNDEEDIQSKMKKLLNSVDLSSLLSLLYGEHPQLLAIIIEMLDKEKAKLFLETSPPELQGELIYRIAKQKKVASTVMNQIYNILSRKLSQSTRELGNQSGGLDTAIDLLNNISSGTEKNVMRYIDTVNSKFGQKLKKKLFVFGDIASLDDDAIKTIIDKADFNRLILSLRGAEKELKDKFVNSIESRDKKNELISQIEKQSPVRTKDIENARHYILTLIKDLEENSLLTIPTKENVN
jgi:flagellar motor switch protein FliG